MDERPSRSLTIVFGTDPQGGDPVEPLCPDGYAGYVPPSSNGGGGGGGVQPVDGKRLAVVFDSHAAGKLLGNWVNRDSGLPHTQFMVSFSPSDPSEDCGQFPMIICWRPSPFDYLNLWVTEVIYSGHYPKDDVLPYLSASFDQENQSIKVEDIEDEEGKPIKPSIRVMWPTGDLGRFLRMQSHSNDWFEVTYRFRKQPIPPIPTQNLPDMWVTMTIPGDGETAMGDPIYAWRIPVRFTLAEGLVEPAPTADAYGTLYQELITPDDAFKPHTTSGGGISVADPPKDDEEPSAPGIDFNEAGLTAWVTENGEPQADEYTLMMEVLPAYGRFELHGKYICNDEIGDLYGTHTMNRDWSSFLDYSLLRKPVAYLKLGRDYWIDFIFEWSYGTDGTYVGFWYEVIEPEAAKVMNDVNLPYQSSNSHWPDNAWELDPPFPVYQSHIVDGERVHLDFGKVPLKFKLHAAWSGSVGTGRIKFSAATYPRDIENFIVEDWVWQPDVAPGVYGGQPFFKLDMTLVVTALLNLQPIGYITVYPSGSISFDPI